MKYGTEYDVERSIAHESTLKLGIISLATGVDNDILNATHMLLKIKRNNSCQKRNIFC